MCALRGWKSFESELKRIQLERWSKSDTGARSSSDTTNVRDFEEDWIKLWSDMKDDMRKGKFDVERIQWCDKSCDNHSDGKLVDPYCGKLQARVAWQEVTLFPDPSHLRRILSWSTDDKILSSMELFTPETSRSFSTLRTNAQTQCVKSRTARIGSCSNAQHACS